MAGPRQTSSRFKTLGSWIRYWRGYRAASNSKRIAIFQLRAIAEKGFVRPEIAALE